MQLTPEQVQIGSENFNRVSSSLNDGDVSRRDFMKAAAASFQAAMLSAMDWSLSRSRALSCC